MQTHWENPQVSDNKYFLATFSLRQFVAQVAVLFESLGFSKTAESRLRFFGIHLKS